MSVKYWGVVRTHKGLYYVRELEFRPIPLEDGEEPMTFRTHYDAFWYAVSEDEGVVVGGLYEEEPTEDELLGAP